MEIIKKSVFFLKQFDAQKFSLLKKLLKDEYPGDLIILNILVDIFSDNTLCKNRLIVEIKLHQQTLVGKIDYTKLI